MCNKKNPDAFFSCPSDVDSVLYFLAANSQEWQATCTFCNICNYLYHTVCFSTTNCLTVFATNYGEAWNATILCYLAQTSDQNIHVLLMRFNPNTLYTALKLTKRKRDSTQQHVITPVIRHMSQLIHISEGTSKYRLLKSLFSCVCHSSYAFTD